MNKKLIFLFSCILLFLTAYCGKKSSNSKPVKYPKNIVLKTDDPSFNSKTGEFVKDKYTVGLWHFDEGEGTIVFDSSGNENAGVIVGGKWAKGIFGKSINLSGRNDYVSIENSQSLNPSYAFTVEGWVYINNNQLERGYPAILFKSANLEDLIPSYAFWLVTDKYHPSFKGTNFYWWINVDLSENIYDYILNSRVNWESLVGKWHYLAGTYNGKMSKVYVNGDLVAEMEINGLLRTGDQPLFFGNVPPPRQSPLHDFDGLVDEFRISNVARSSKAIKNYWNVTKKFVDSSK